MLEIPVIRWGQPYESMEKQPVVHFETGEELASVHQANGGLIKMDMRKANKARDILRQFSIEELCEMAAKAADLYMEADPAAGKRNPVSRPSSARCSPPRPACRSTCARGTCGRTPTSSSTCRTRSRHSLGGCRLRS